MRELYEVVLEEYKVEKCQKQVEEPEIKVFNLSYDICPKGTEDELENETFIPYLYKKDIISTDVEFVVVDDLTKEISNNAEKYYVIRPAESTIIFGSSKSGNEIIAELNEHPELHFAIVELPNKRNTIRPMVINHIDEGAHAQVKKAKEEKDEKQHIILKRFNPNAGIKEQPKCIMKIVKTSK